MPTPDSPCIEVSLLYQESIAAHVWDGIEKGVTAEEEDKAGRFVFARDRRAYLAAHWLKRQALSRADPATDPLSWCFEYGPHGKPQIAGCSTMHFNLSHCDGLVACALRRDGPIGIDVECLSRPAPSEVVLHYFSAAEAAWWHAQPEPTKREAFFSVWTLKEAFVKATGDGLSLPLQSFSVCPDSLALSLEGEMRSAAGGWRFHRAQPDNQHLLALAWRSCGGREETVALMVAQPDAWA